MRLKSFSEIAFVIVFIVEGNDFKYCSKISCASSSEKPILLTISEIIELID